jgi:DNA-binding PadR family transcriptional regulator
MPWASGALRPVLWRVVNGKVRKYYRITALGQQVLALVRPKFREPVGEVLVDKPGTDPDKR